MSIPTRGLWQYSYAVPAEMEAPAWRNPGCDSSRLSDPETLVSWSTYTADGSGTVNRFPKKNGLAFYNVFSHWAFSSAKNVGNNNIKKNLGTHFLFSLGKRRETNRKEHFISTPEQLPSPIPPVALL